MQRWKQIFVLFSKASLLPFRLENPSPISAQVALHLTSSQCPSIVASRPTELKAKQTVVLSNIYFTGYERPSKFQIASHRNAKNTKTPIVRHA
jgi:hypothetical protein